ncbi:transporter [Croceicoccus naphthovorans]|uniref:Uncharacterized protein n=1 Tax=Croceicoccus naphthovorans TaxID=1348774 RepID=A0A0G3XGM3_9SPHN|nr:transporter [Croceicoccus naphthovorans]AKM10670.1 hypothetical protein AB433_12960 [Croceicoccus naphthovorans]MBB3988906.1 hypothetical protein [Croceicoccus naphthovorans]
MRYALYLIFLTLSAPALANDGAALTDREQSATPTRITLVAGAEYASGEFAEEDYQTSAAVAGVSVSRGPVSLSASVPYLVTTAPKYLIVNQGGLLGTPLFASSDIEFRPVRRKGIGDVSVQAAYRLPVRGFDAAVAASAKIPTASEKRGLGTGAFDYGVAGQISKRFGSVIPFVGAGYTFVGKPDTFDVHDTLSGTAGASIGFSRTSAVSLSYAYEQSQSSQAGDRQSVGVDLGTQLAPNLRLGLNGRAGLSEDAPDAKLGLRIGLGF